MRASILALLLLGCGGGAYRQAAVPAPMVRPAPSTPTVGGYAPVGMGLPGERMPEGERQRWERSPNKSVKPVKDWDTLYQADGVKATRKGHYPYEVGEPFFEVAGDLRGLPTQCAAIMTETLQRVSRGLDKRDIDATEAICLDAQLYAICVGWQTEGRTDEVAKRARRQADENALDACSRHSRTPTVMRLVDAVRRSREK